MHPIFFQLCSLLLLPIRLREVSCGLVYQLGGLGLLRHIASSTQTAWRVVHIKPPLVKLCVDYDRGVSVASRPNARCLKIVVVGNSTGKILLPLACGLFLLS